MLARRLAFDTSGFPEHRGMMRSMISRDRNGARHLAAQGWTGPQSDTRDSLGSTWAVPVQDSGLPAFACKFDQLIGFLYRCSIAASHGRRRHVFAADGNAGRALDLVVAGKLVGTRNACLYAK